MTAALAPRRPRTLEEFVLWQAGQDQRHEWRNGQIRMMTGGALRNTRIAQTIAGQINAKIKGGPCFAYVENAMVRIEQAGAGYYPDVVVDCGTYDPKALAVADPRVVFEILSPSTAASDRAEKVPDYRDHGRIEQIVLIDPDTQAIEIWYVRNGRWAQTFRDPGAETLALWPLALELSIGEMFEGA